MKWCESLKFKTEYVIIININTFEIKKKLILLFPLCYALNYCLLNLKLRNKITILTFCASKFINKNNKLILKIYQIDNCKDV